MADKATVTGLAVGPANPPRPLYREARESIELVAEQGVVGDKTFGRSRTRHVNVINARSYAWFAASFGRVPAAPGAFGEQMVVSDAIDLNWLPLGAKLRVGGALLEVVTARTPCEDLARAVNGDKPSHFVGRVGVMCRVLESGTVRMGDAVQPV